MNLKESCFPDYWKVSLVVIVFQNVRERSTPKSYFSVSVLSMVSKLVNNRFFDNLEKYGLYSDLQYNFRLLNQLQIF